ncbi:MAG: ABC transporter permease [Acidobacteria bacterium]|nr:ABC transporter permease [Acidobacteriota bacterium]
MLAYSGRRLLAAIPLVWGVLTIVFLLLEAAPGRPFDLDAGPGVDPDAAGRLRQAFGADRPLPERYLGWLWSCVTAEWGVSFALRRPVAELLRETVGNTFRLAGVVIVLQFLLGSAAGVTAAWSRRRWLDRGIVTAASILYSVPSFCLGLVLTWILSVKLGYLPVSQMRSLDASSLGHLPRFLDALRHLVLPCLSLTLPAAAGVALYVRDELKAVMGLGFMRAARARGHGERDAALLRQALRNAALPALNLMGVALPGLLGGSVVIEALFAWPGMGRLAYQAVLSRDEPLILACTLVFSVLVILGSLLADLLSAAVDPRVRESLS